MNKDAGFGIRGRLFLAFSAIAATTIAASVVGWLSYDSLGGDLRRIVSESIPAVTLGARLAEKGGLLMATAPALVAASDESERNRIWSNLKVHEREMAALMGRMELQVFDETVKSTLRGLVKSLSQNLQALDEDVRQGFRYASRNTNLVERMRWAHAEFMDEVEPMLGDVRFNVELALERVGKSSSAGERSGYQETLETNIRRQEALARINADGNLVVGLLARAASLRELDPLQDTYLFLGEVKSGLTEELALLEELPSALSLRQAVDDILAYMDGDASLFELRRKELAIQKRGQKLLETNRTLVGKIQNLLRRQVDIGNAAAIAATAGSRDAIQRGKVVFLLMASGGLAVAVLVVWLYVGRNLVRRIRELDHAMLAIAAGDLETRVPVGGRDEISDMAKALDTFRDTLVETQAELVQAGKLAALGQLTTGIAHELNQPIAAILSYAHNGRILLERNKTEEVDSNLEKISDLAKRTGDLISHLKNLARMPSKQMERVDLNFITVNALSLMEARTHKEGVEVVLEFPEHGPWVQAEAIRLEQVIINLIGNALDSMKAHDRRELTVLAKEDNGKVVLAVKDTGEGIPKENLARLFDPFFTTKDPGEGLGLGLSISYNIVKDFGGSIKVSSKMGRGSSFSMTLIQA